jgi:hypothetical protein
MNTKEGKEGFVGSARARGREVSGGVSSKRQLLACTHLVGWLRRCLLQKDIKRWWTLNSGHGDVLCACLWWSLGGCSGHKHAASHIARHFATLELQSQDPCSGTVKARDNTVSANIMRRHIMLQRGSMSPPWPLAGVQLD